MKRTATRRCDGEEEPLPWGVCRAIGVKLATTFRQKLNKVLGLGGVYNKSS